MEDSHANDELARIRARFFAKTKWADEPHPILGTKCLLWTAWIRTAFGHGGFTFHGQAELAHRVAWILEFGAIPDEMCALHRCDNPPCVNVEHLFLGTQIDNIKDRDSKGRGVQVCGENHGNAKMTWEKVALLRERYSQGIGCPTLAKDFGIDGSTAWDIAMGHTWKNIKLVESAIDAVTPALAIQMP